ncbi:MAG: nucleoside 2-deoxyribosyltransferase [Chloroflexota bacterium]
MKAFLSIKYHADHGNRARIEMIAAALQSRGIAAVCIARDVEQWGARRFDPAELMRRTFAAIDACDLVVVDLTEKGVGVGIEAGYARAKNIPIVAIAETGADISETLRGVSRTVFWYAGLDDLRGAIKEMIRNFPERCFDDETNVRNQS